MKPRRYNPRAQIYSLVIVFAFILLLIIVIILTSHSKGPTTKQQLDAQQKALASSAYADPILKYLPYGDIGYNIEPTLKTISGKSVLALQITIILTDADYKSGPANLQATISAHQQQALNYIRSIGFDPGKYKIEYIIPDQ